MTRVNLPTREEVPAESQAILDQLKAGMGMVPNLFKVLSLSPNAMTGVVGLQRAMMKTLKPRIRDHIALAVSQVNGCHYCLSAHSFASATFTKMTPEEIISARRGESSDPMENAAVKFAQKVTQLRGKVTNTDFDEVRAAGFSDAEIVEIVVLSVQFGLTNFLNNVFDTEIDFPVVSVDLDAAA